MVHLMVDPIDIVTFCWLKKKSSIDTSTVPPAGTQVGLGGTLVAVAVRVAVEVAGATVFVGTGVPPVVTVSHVAMIGPKLPKPP